MAKINFQIATMAFGSVTDLLNGAFASLSGPVGFSATQPRVYVKSIRLSNSSTSPTNSPAFVIYKGASGASAPGTEVLVGSIGPLSTIEQELDLVLDASDFLTGHCISSGSVSVDISAEIHF